MAFFPMKGKSGKANGGVVESTMHKPSKDGSIIYLNANPRLEKKAELEGAFKPLHCIAQVYDTGQKLRFKVFDRDYDTACEMADLSLKALLDQTLLSDVIQRARRQIQSSGRFRTTE